MLFKRISGVALVELLAEATNPRGRGSVYYRQRSLLMLDCTLRVIDAPSINSVLELGTKRFGELQDLFYSALASRKFNALAPATRIGYARAFYTLMRDLGQKFAVEPSSFVPNSNKELPDELADSFDRINLNETEVAKLRPFLLTPKKGKAYNVLLTPMVRAIGWDFTIKFHNAISAIAGAKAKDTALRDFGTTFAKFLEEQFESGRPITEAQLQDGRFVREMLVDFMEYHFKKMLSMKGGAKEGTLASLQKTWSRYAIYLEIVSKKGVIGEPLFGIPEGKPSLSNVKEVRHQRKSGPSDDGSSGVTHKLLTPVPLHLSDEETTHLIFNQINKDFTVVQNWLDSHLEGLWLIYERGLSLAGPKPYQFANGDALIDSLNPKKNPDALVEAVRYFKHYHDGYVDASRVETAAYPNKAARGGVSKVKLAQLLGVPRLEDALAMMGYLASVDGRFTESALAEAQLFDLNNTRINAVNSGNNTLTLSVHKERGGQSGWHDVILSGRAYMFMQRWLQLTAPLRAYMRKNHIAGWRNLFIYAGQPLGKPAFFEASNINSFFRVFAQRHGAALGELAEYVTITRIRAQKGILVFLKDFDIKAMARELGNDPETSMRHYLPDAIWNYFAVRWIRIFQNLLIVEATRSTPYMARALRFENASELDEFLKNHALEPLIPASPKQPDLFAEKSASGGKDVDPLTVPKVQEIMVAASRGLFSTLLSVKEAVKFAMDAGDEVHDKALYWYEFAKRLQNHVESDKYPDRGIKKLMKAAALDVSPENFSKAVRA